MKNNNDHQYEIRKARDNQVQRATTDILVNPSVVEQNAAKVAAPPRRRRRNYAKKIMNDDFLMNL